MAGKIWTQSTVSLVPSSDEPSYSPGSDALILSDSFDSYANFAAAEANYSVGVHHEFCSLISPGRGGSGKAVRLSYGIGQGEDILFGTEGQELGDWSAEPYTHFLFSTWLRFSSGADPADHDENGVKGFMFWCDDHTRYEAACNQLVQTGATRCFKFFNPNNAQSGLNVWKTVDGKAPLMSTYADGNWHRATFDIHCGAIPAGQRGIRIWVDGTKIYDDVGVDVITGQTEENKGYTYSRPIAYWAFFGNFINSTAKSTAFTLDFDDWIAWTN